MKAQEKHARLFHAFGCAALLTVSACMAVAQSGEKAALQQTLNAQFKLTRMSADRWQVADAGTVAELKKDGLMMYSVAAPMQQSNSYKNGKISLSGGGVAKSLFFGLSASGGGENYPQRRFVAGERFWVTKIDVQDDGVLFNLVSDAYDDQRYYGNLKVNFAGKDFPNQDAALKGEARAIDYIIRAGIRS